MKIKNKHVKDIAFIVVLLTIFTILMLVFIPKQADTTVYAIGDSHIYHKSECRYIAHVKNTNRFVKFADSNYAKIAGYRPCKVCF